MGSAFQIREKYRSYAEEELLSDSFMDLSLISDILAHTHCMRTILADAVLQNRVIKQFQTIWETTDFLAEFPILSLDFVETFMQNSRQCGPITKCKWKLPTMTAYLS